ncbi:hypothetical protein [Providencia sp. PROV077]|uniref:hypothetical protein n=1 Tax=Providencia sp. PROV077 TaxID=2949799 RepID=UPI002349B62F|nr:hypothetical protein [Providencia sp. PROV077]
MNPLWMYSPDWSERVTETLSWKTDVYVSPTGAEQRVARRMTPRRQFEFSVLVGDVARQQLENQLAMHGAGVWSLPLFTEGALLQNDLAVGQTVIAYPHADVLLAGISHLYLVQHEQVALLPIIALSADMVTVFPLNQAWYAGTEIYPVALAMLTDMPPVTRFTDSLSRLQCRFRLQQANPFSASMPPVSYRGFPVWDFPADWQEDRKAEYQRQLLELDNGYGLPFRTDTAKRAFYLQHHQWLLAGIENQVLLRQRLMWLRGRQRAVWVSHQTDDLTAISVNGYQLTVINSGLSIIQYKQGRRDLAMLLVDGSSIYGRIVNVQQVGEFEQLQLDVVLPSVEQIQCISFMTLCRQNTDDVTFTYHSGRDGVAEVSTVFRGVRDELE